MNSNNGQANSSIGSFFRKCRRFRIVFWAAGVALVLFALEGLCRLIVQPPTGTFLTTAVDAGGGRIIDNPAFGTRFLPEAFAELDAPVSVDLNRGGDVLRVCLLGDSTAASVAAPMYGLARHMEVLLAHAYPQKRVEVLDLCVDNGNSHVLREVAKELEALQPDITVVMCGSNEMTGPFGPADLYAAYRTRFLTPQLSIWFSRTAIGAWVRQNKSAGVHFGDTPALSRTLLDVDASERRQAQQGFKKNLKWMVNASKRHSGHTVLLTLPVNVYDCPPFATDYGQDERLAQVVRECHRDAAEAFQKGDLEAEGAAYAAAYEQAPWHADNLFLYAAYMERSGNDERARELYREANEADALPMRPTDEINRIIREIAGEEAGEEGFSWVDAEALFASNFRTGESLFLDYVHPSFEGNHLLARAIGDAVSSTPALRDAGATAWPDKATVEDAMLYIPWGLAQQLQHVLDAQRKPPFRTQLHHLETIKTLAENAGKALARVEAMPPELALAAFQRHAAGQPENPWLALATAQQALEVGKTDVALHMLEKPIQRWAHRLNIQCMQLIAQSLQDESTSPAAAIENVQRMHPANGLFNIRLAWRTGSVLRKMNHTKLAIPWLEYAHALDSADILVNIELAWAYFEAKRTDDAAHLLTGLSEKYPDSAIIWEELCVFYCLTKEWDKSNECFARAGLIAPQRYARYFRLAEALVQLGAHKRAMPALKIYMNAEPGDLVAAKLAERITPLIPVVAEPEAESSDFLLPWEKIIL